MKCFSVLLVAVFCTLFCSGMAGMFDHSNVVKLDSTTFKEKVRTRLQYLATEAYKISTVLIISASSETQRRITVWLLHHNACANVLF